MSFQAQTDTHQSIWQWIRDLDPLLQGVISATYLVFLIVEVARFSFSQRILVSNNILLTKLTFMIFNTPTSSKFIGGKPMKDI
ncbi:MAG: hypothetical protein ACTSRP_13540 [Candidatus Helarchaeota archaeon]